MIETYLPVFVFLVFGCAMAAATFIAASLVTRFLGVHRPTLEKLSPYECGFKAFEDARLKFDVRFYLVAILFIVFDLEIAFLFPWAIVLRELSWAGFLSMGVFVGLLIIGFIYEWKKGALEWE